MQKILLVHPNKLLAVFVAVHTQHKFVADFGAQTATKNNNAT